MLHAEYQVLTHWLFQHPVGAGILTFVIAFLESLIIVGTIIPGSITMTAIGIMMGSGVVGVPLTIALASAGAFIGDGISYIIGYRFRDTLPQKWPFRLVPKLMAKGKSYFEKHGGKSVFIGRFVGAIRAMVPVIAGMMHMKPWQYFPISFCSAILWAIVYLFPGFLIGYASEALPPGLASHVIIYLFIFLIALWAIYWVCKEIVIHFGRRIDRFLDRRWTSMVKGRAWRWLTVLIRNAEEPSHHGQFAVSIFFIITLALFITVLVHVSHHSPIHDINTWVNHVMRGLRAVHLQSFMLILTAIASAQTLIPAVIVVSAWLWFKRRRYAACHFLIVCFAAAGCAWLLKRGLHIARPIGIVGVKNSGSFPSGHAALATVVYAYAAWFIGFCKPKWLKASYWLGLILLVLVFMSRLYLGDHWLTDVLGAFLFSMLFVFAGIISFHRFHAKPVKVLNFLVPLILSVIVFASFNIYRTYHREFIRTQLVWPEEQIQQSNWWAKRDLLIPEYRKNLLNQPTQVLNLQWAGSLDDIKSTLIKQGWIVFLHKRKQEKHDPLKQLELFPELYQAQLPSVIMVNNHHQPGLVLRLWNSHIQLLPQKIPLWLGTITYNLRPTSLLTKKKTVHLSSVLSTLMPAIKAKYQWRVLKANLPYELQKPIYAKHILLIEPKNIQITGTTK